MNYIIAFITIITIALGGLKLFRMLGIREHQKWADFYKRKPVINAQGIRTGVSIIIGFLIMAPQYRNHSSFVIYAWAIIVLGTVSMIDLYRPIPSRIRLIIQLLVFTGVVIYAWVDIESIRLRWDKPFILPIRLNIAMSITRFVVCTNAINLFDGIEWQSSGITAIGTWSIWCVINLIILQQYVSLTPSTYEQLSITSYLALVVTMAAIVYTWVEYKPHWLVRDIGTIIYGFSLAYLSLLGGVKVWTIVVVLSLVLFDFIRVMYNRLFIKHKNPMKGDYTHLHHRLLANGRSRSEVRWFVWIWSAMMMILMLLQWTNSINKWIIFALMGSLFFGVHIYLFRIKKLPDHYDIAFSPEDVERIR